MQQRFLTGNQDLFSTDIKKRRDTGVLTYNTMREICGFKRANVFEDFIDFIPKSVSWHLLLISFRARSLCSSSQIFAKWLLGELNFL